MRGFMQNFYVLKRGHIGKKDVFIKEYQAPEALNKNYNKGLPFNVSKDTTIRLFVYTDETHHKNVRTKD